MSYQVLARKWRPRSFQQMVGQEHVLRALINALDQGRLHHAYLFTGTRGVGKTTLARILAKCLNCETGVSSQPCGTCSACREIDEGRFVDLIEVDAASRTKVEDTRELLENVLYTPTRGRYKVYLIDEVHMLSMHSFNALLKTLEEPPPHVKFLLATTDPQRLPVTVLSRCLQFNLKRMPPERIREYLAQVLSAESIPYEPTALAAIARAADGSMRDALSLLDQAIAYGAGRVTQAEVQAMLGTLDRDQVLDLLQCLAAGDAGAVLSVVERLAELAPDFGEVLAELLSVLQRLALAQVVPQVLEQEDRAERLRELAGRLTPEDVQLFYQIALIGRRDLPLAPDPRGGLEMVLLRMLAFRPAEAEQGAEQAAGPPVEARSVTISVRPPSRADTQAPPPIQRSQLVAPELVVVPEPVTPERAPLVQGDWSAMVAALPGGLPRTIASYCVLDRREGNTFYLIGDPVHHTLLQGENSEVRLGQALERQLGIPVKVRIAVGTLSERTPAQCQEHSQAERQRGAVESIARDPYVQEMQEKLGAVVRQDSIRPIDE